MSPLPPLPCLSCPALPDPRYPDSNVPTLLLYYDGSCKQHLVGLNQFGGQRATPERE